MIIGHVTIERVARVESLCACVAAVASCGGEMFGLEMALAGKAVPEVGLADEAGVAAASAQLSQVPLRQLFQLTYTQQNTIYSSSKVLNFKKF
jgi:hypothetical protein